MLVKSLHIALIGFLTWNMAYSQKVEFYRMSSQDGLLGTNVTSILKDSYGFMWFGTFSGLLNYDGYKVKSFLKNEDPNSSEKSDVSCLFESKDRQLLIGTRNGLCIYNRDDETFTRYVHEENNPGSLGHNRIRTIYEDSKGNIWIGTNGGLDKFNAKTKTFQHYLPFKNDSPLVTSIVEDEKGNFWIYGGKDLCYFKQDKNEFKYVKMIEDFGPKERSGVLLYDKEGNLWIGNLLDGLLKYDIARGRKERFSVANNTLKSNTVRCLIQDSDGDIWVGTDGGGLNRYRSETNDFERFEHDSGDPTSLNGNAVYAIYESDPGIVWIGVYSGGVNVFKRDKRKFLQFTSKGEPGKALSYQAVLSIADAGNGKVWLGTDGGGLNLFDPSTYDFKYYTEEKGGVCGNVVKSILLDADKNIWCGTYQKGLCKKEFSTGRILNFREDINEPEKSIFKDNVWSLCESRDGKIWIGLLSGGVNVFDKESGSFTHNPLNVFHPTHERSSIFVLFEDSRGRMWAGTKTAGIICYSSDRKSFVHFNYESDKKKSIRSNEIRDIFEDSKGDIWFATLKGGLSRLLDFETKEFETFTVQDGLPTDDVLGILEDEKQNLWLSTDKGLTCFKVKEKKFIHFDNEDGLQSSKFISRSKFLDAKGYMYFGGHEGFNMFHPDSIRFNHIVPPVVITNFKIFQNSIEPNVSYKERIYLTKSISQTKDIELLYQDFVFSIEFSALSFASPLKNKYAYKLEGFDKEWSYVDADKRFATYTNLNPGEYNFRVIASNNDGVWNTAGTSLRIVVLPPWWMTWWLKVLIALGMTSIVFVYIYIRTKSVKERNKLLQEEVKKQTRDLNEVNLDLVEKNQEITLKNEILEENNLEISRKTSRILEQQERILKQNNELEQLNKTKDKFFSIVAHDLKNPVNALTVLSQMLKKEFPHVGDSGRDLMNNIEISSERIKNLVLNLLEWARSQTGNIKVDPIKISIYKLVEENVQLYIPLASHKKIIVKAEIDESHYIYADYNMISTIVRNILGNNIKYTPKGGEVLIASEIGKDKQVILSFKDTGIGMSEEILDKLFKIETTFSSKGTENETGTGLGLIISKEFAELNKGSILIKSAIGKGSIFYLTFPGGSEQLQERYMEKNITITSSLPVSIGSENNLKVPYVKEEFKGKKILLVDDDEQIRNAVKYLLSDIFEVFEATNVKSAMALSEKIFPDLIISDIVMPGETGISFCHTIKSNKLTCHIPVILLTGQSSGETHLEGLMAGADGYITKPFDRKIFLTTISNLLTSLENSKVRFSSGPELALTEIAKSKHDVELLHRAIELIERNISDPNLNGDTLCKQLGISKSVLYLKLKNLTGQTVNEFIRIIRLKKCIKPLMEGELNISQLSVEMGFNSPSYFTRSFTQHFGTSPKEYVAKHKSNI